MARAGVQWRGSLAGYVNTILSRSRPANSSIFSKSIHNSSKCAPSNLYRSQNTVSNSQVLAHSCLSSSGKRLAWETPLLARALPLTRRGFGVKKSGVTGIGDCLASDFLASNSLAVIRVPGMERPAAKNELMTIEDTDS